MIEHGIARIYAKRQVIVLYISSIDMDRDPPGKITDNE